MIVKQRKEDRSRAVVLDFISAPSADYTGVTALKELVKELSDIDVQVHFARLSPGLLSTLDSSNIWNDYALCHTDMAAALSAAQAFARTPRDTGSSTLTTPLLPVN